MDEDKKIQGFVGVGRDITEQKANAEALRHLTTRLEALVAERTDKLHQAVQEAEAANRAKSDFLAQMSHELRTPQHAILSFANMIQKKSMDLMNHMDGIDDPEIIHYLSETLHIDRGSWESEIHLWLSRIIENQKRQLNIVNNLLDFAKLESGKETFKFKTNDLVKIIHSSREELESLLKEKSIEMTIVAEKVNTKVSMDQNALSGVIKNIVGNAIKFTPVGGEITVSLEDGILGSAAALVLTIRDTGIGIPQRELESIFEPFVQSSRVEGRSLGSGLGLALCQKIIIAHQGTIHASNHPEGGSVFTIVLPRKICNKKITRDI